MDIAVKLTLVASIVMMGYNISEVVMPFKTLCEKFEEVKKLAKAADTSDMELRKSNILISLVLNVIFAVLIYLSGFAVWLLLLVFAKMLVTLYLSDWALVEMLRSETIEKKYYLVTKLDSLANALLGLSIAVLVVL